MDLHLVTLPLAASLAYDQIVGENLVPQESARRRHALDDMAHALALYAPIYANDPASGESMELPCASLIDGIFEHGAQFFTTNNGNTYSGLSIQKEDMQAAITILSRARTPA